MDKDPASPKSELRDEEEEIFSAKNQIVNILGFEGHVVSVATTKLFHCSIKVAIGQ